MYRRPFTNAPAPPMYAAFDAAKSRVIYAHETPLLSLCERAALLPATRRGKRDRRACCWSFASPGWSWGQRRAPAETDLIKSVIEIYAA